MLWRFALTLLAARRAEAEQRMWTACSYPRPGGGPGAVYSRSNCSRAYLGLDYICDPGASLSRSAAALLDTLLAPHFVPCHCDTKKDLECRNGLHHLGKARLAIAIVPLASVQGRRRPGDPWHLCPPAAERLSPKDPVKDWMELYRDTLVEQFCPKALQDPFVFITVLLDWSLFRLSKTWEEGSRKGKKQVE